MDKLRTNRQIHDVNNWFADPGFLSRNLRGGLTDYVGYANAHQEREARSRLHGRGPGHLEAFVILFALSCYLRIVLKHSHTKYIFMRGGGGVQGGHPPPPPPWIRHCDYVCMPLKTNCEMIMYFGWLPVIEKNSERGVFVSFFFVGGGGAIGEIIFPRSYTQIWIVNDSKMEK